MGRKENVGVFDITTFPRTLFFFFFSSSFSFLNFYRVNLSIFFTFLFLLGNFVMNVCGKCNFLLLRNTLYFPPVCEQKKPWLFGQSSNTFDSISLN